ncbi:cellulose synthase catalytic subunit (UDP-forming) [Acanthocystis turfacea Chlorella virus TN603.4.2]|nr:cellulose synthase catalytic subunit (UDP-forming) [Acanthocystis turfacea Chlorella virus TN603.4.2]
MNPGYPSTTDMNASSGEIYEKHKDDIDSSHGENSIRDEKVDVDPFVVPKGMVLPRPPNDELKVAYLHTRKPLVAFFAFISMAVFSTGIILFMNGTGAWWFWAICANIIVSAIVTYILVIIIGRGFDFKKHSEIIERVRNDAEDPFAPSVDILLPVCGEELCVLNNTWKYVSKVRHNGVLQVHVLDDSASKSVEKLANEYGFVYHVRDNRPYMKKAGNLRASFTKTSGDFFVILDADFCPREDFLESVLGLMKNDPTIAIIQTPQFFEQRKEQNYLERGAGAVQELFYRLIQPARNSSRKTWFGKYEPAYGSICVGTCAIYRRSALAPMGGTAEVEHSEDVRTGFRATKEGYHVEYVPLNLACGVCPNEHRAFFAQQYRWCSGSTTLLTSGEFWTTKLGFVRRMCYISGMLFYSTSMMTLFLGPALSNILIWLFPEVILYYNISFALVGIIIMLLLLPLWSVQSWPYGAYATICAQNFAYTWAIKDKIFNTVGSWTPSGNCGKKSQMAVKYRNARIFAGILTLGNFTSVFVGSFLQILLFKDSEWYNFLPLMLITTFYTSNYLPFIFNF